MTNITGKVALVTGASSGIGAATAFKLAAAGAKVGIAARRAEKLERIKSEITAKGGEALVIEMDVVDPASVEAGVEKLVGAFGSIDIVVNNAGLMPLSDVDQLKTDEWHRMVDVNIKGLLNTTAAVLPQMVKQHSGHIFNMSSIAGLVGADFNVAYCASKGAVRLMTKAVAVEFSALGYKVRVNSVHPGGVNTGMVDSIFQAYVDLGVIDSAKTAYDLSSAAHLLRRMAEPAEIAAGVRFLASDEASYMHGSELVLDGGYTAR